MLALCTAMLAIGFGTSSTNVQSFYDGFVDPKVQHDIEVRQRRLSDNVELVNNTRLFMSAKITSLDEKAETLTPHVGLKLVDVIPVLADDMLVGPQGSLLSGGWSTVVSYNAPSGRNALVSVVTCGIQDMHELTPEEYILWRHLFARTLADQYVLPILNWGCGVKFDSRETVGIVAGLITGHNSQIIEQALAVLKSGSPSEFSYFMWQIMIREIETGGPIASYFARRFGKNLAAEFAKRLAEKAIIRSIPGAGAIDVFLSILNTGGTFANFVPSSWDLMSVPAKLEYRAYFVPGLGDVYPKIIRMDGKDDEITLVGHKLVPIPGKAFKVTVSEKNRGQIFETSTLRTTTRGRSVHFTLPESAIGNRKGPLTYAMTIDKMEVKCAEGTEIIQDLRVLRLEPDRGPPGTRVRIYADGLQPYIITNKVQIQAPDALIPESGVSELVSKLWVEFTVPNIFVERPTLHNVFIEEEYGGNRKESRKLPFTVEPGTARERAEKHREWSMPEVKFSIQGVLDEATPARSHLLDVPAGMQVEVELAQVSGPEGDNLGGELEYWSLYLLTSKRGEPLQGVSVADRFTEVTSRGVGGGDSTD